MMPQRIQQGRAGVEIKGAARAVDGEFYAHGGPLVTRGRDVCARHAEPVTPGAAIGSAGGSGDGVQP